MAHKAVLSSLNSPNHVVRAVDLPLFLDSVANQVIADYVVVVGAQGIPLDLLALNACASLLTTSHIGRDFEWLVGVLWERELPPQCQLLGYLLLVRLLGVVDTLLGEDDLLKHTQLFATVLARLVL